MKINLAVLKKLDINDIYIYTNNNYASLIIYVVEYASGPDRENVHRERCGNDDRDDNNRVELRRYVYNLNIDVSISILYIYIYIYI